MDGKFVKNKTMPFREMRHVSDYTDKRLDIHLMVEDPSKYIPLYAELNCEVIYIHVEIDEDIMKDLDMIKKYSIKCGLAINPDTKVSELVPYLPYLDYILVMSVYPGMGGQSFITSVSDKIKEIKDLIKSYNVKCLVNVDGGVNNDTIKYCRDCDIVTSGSYITNGSNFQEKISSLR